MFIVGKYQLTAAYAVSATWPEAVRRLASTFQRNPVRVTVGSDDLTANSRVTQVVEVFDDARSKEYASFVKCQQVTALNAPLVNVSLQHCVRYHTARQSKGVQMIPASWFLRCIRRKLQEWKRCSKDKAIPSALFTETCPRLHEWRCWTALKMEKPI